MPLPKDPIKREEWLAKQRSRIASIDTRIKMSVSRTGQKRSEETKKKMSESRIGFHLTDSAKSKISMFNKGKKLSKEHINNISNSLKNKYKMEPHHMLGKKLKDSTIEILKRYHCEHNHMSGKQHNKESIQKMSEARKGKYCGINSPTWKGGITKITLQIRHMDKYKNWREVVFTKDNYTCLLCKKCGGKLEAHHIIPFSIILDKYNIRSVEDASICDFLWEINNGITLCKSCHHKIHRRDD